jgi:hypothetical protein
MDLPQESTAHVLQYDRVPNVDIQKSDPIDPQPRARYSDGAAVELETVLVGSTTRISAHEENQKSPKNQTQKTVYSPAESDEGIRTYPSVNVLSGP